MTGLFLPSQLPVEGQSGTIHHLCFNFTPLPHSSLLDVEVRKTFKDVWHELQAETLEHAAHSHFQNYVPFVSGLFKHCQLPKTLNQLRYHDQLNVLWECIRVLRQRCTHKKPDAFNVDCSVFSWRF